MQHELTAIYIHMALKHYKCLYKQMQDAYERQKAKRAKALMFVQDLEDKNEALRAELEFKEETISMLYRVIQILKQEDNRGED
jgi:predicted GIY-YIG superfamily endonuclease